MSAQIEPYYRAALQTLRCLEARSPTKRRFCAEADALWRGFQGDLKTTDRIDLMIRDADAQWPGAFGARSVFGLEGVAEDEAFGSQWRALDPVRAEELWRELVRTEVPGSTQEALGACAAEWRLKLAPFDCGTINPADQVLVCGPSAIVASALVFEGGRSLDWAAQVACIATDPTSRQLASLAGALLGATKALPLFSAAAAAPSEAKAAGARKPGATTLTGRRLLLSPDAVAADAATARQLSGS